MSFLWVENLPWVNFATLEKYRNFEKSEILTWPDARNDFFEIEVFLRIE